MATIEVVLFFAINGGIFFGPLKTESCKLLDTDTVWIVIWLYFLHRKAKESFTYISKVALVFAVVDVDR